jgi:hypothetical protein
MSEAKQEEEPVLSLESEALRGSKKKKRKLPLFISNQPSNETNVAADMTIILADMIGSYLFLHIRETLCQKQSGPCEDLILGDEWNCGHDCIDMDDRIFVISDWIKDNLGPGYSTYQKSFPCGEIDGLTQYTDVVVVERIYECKLMRSVVEDLNYIRKEAFCYPIPDLSRICHIRLTHLEGISHTR